MLKIIPAVLILIMLCLPTGVWWLSVHSLPAKEGVSLVNSLGDQVVVHFDWQGIPYIQAQSERDLYQAQGYLAAADRLFQMDLSRREASGELAEIFGPGSLPSDKLMRIFGFRHLAAAELNSLSPPVREDLDAYCQGVNTYINQNHDHLPLEFAVVGYKPRQWDPVDSLTMLKYQAFRLDESWKLDEMRQRILNKIGGAAYKQLFVNRQNTGRQQASNLPSGQTCITSLARSESPRQSLASAEILDSLDNSAQGNLTNGWQASKPSVGSNAIAISGRLSQSKAALIALDKHTSLTLPDLYYSVSLQAPGLHVAGASIAGIPGIIFGRNDWIAWGSTSLKADTQDLFKEQFSSQFPKEYRTETGWRTQEERVETIATRFGQPYVLTVISTRHGPVIIKDGANAIALSWTGFNAGKVVAATGKQDKNAQEQTAQDAGAADASPTSQTATTPPPAAQSGLECLWRLNRAHNWPTFVEALSELPSPALNFVYADRSGNIGSHAAGTIPVRRVVNSGQILSDGWLADGQWVSTIPFAELPAEQNPVSGFKVEANQSPATSSPGGSRWYLGNQFSPNYRANRISAILAATARSGRSIALPDLNEIATDTQAPLAMLVKQEVGKAFDKNNVVDRYQQSGLQELNNWQGLLKADSSGASIYESFLYTTATRMLKPKLGTDLTEEYLNQWPGWRVFVESILINKPEGWLPAEERVYPSFISTSFGQSLKKLRNFFHSDNIANFNWQGAHILTFQQPLSRFLPWLSAVLNISPGGTGGDKTTISTFDIDYHSGDTLLSSPFKVATGPTQRFLIDMFDADKFYLSASLGQSGQLFSRYYDNQLKAWMRYDPVPFAFSSKQIDKQSDHRLVLVNHLQSSP